MSLEKAQGSKVLREGPRPGRIINYRTDPFMTPLRAKYRRSLSQLKKQIRNLQGALRGKEEF